MVKAEQVKEALIRKLATTVVTPDMFVSTGSTVLNMACTGNPKAGFMKGCYYLFVGDSDSGKTFFCLTCLAEAAINKAFDNYRFIYDGPERGALMDIQKFFGKAVFDRMEPPKVGSGGNRCPV